MRTVVLLVSLLAALGVLADGASAEVRVAPVDAPIVPRAGPETAPLIGSASLGVSNAALAGTGTAWTEQTGRSARLLYAADGRTPRVVATSAIDAPTRIEVTGSPEVLAEHATYVACGSDCRDSQLAANVALTGPPAGPFTARDLCGDCRLNYCTAQPLIVSGPYVATRTCGAATWVRHGPGGDRTLPGGLAALAGSLAAFVTTTSGPADPELRQELRVVDLDTGVVRWTRLGTYWQVLGLDAEGRVLAQDGTPAAATQLIGPDGASRPYPWADGTTGVSFAGGRVLVRTLGGDLPARLEVRDLAGALVAATTVHGLVQDPYGRGDLAFDGRYVAWVARACGTVGVARWNLRGDASRFRDPKVCASGAPSGSTARRSKTALSLLVSCPVKATLGCAGRLRAVLETQDARDRRRRPVDRRYVAGTVAYAVKPGARIRVRVSFSHGARRFAARHRRLAARVRLTGVSGEPGDPAFPRTTRSATLGLRWPR